MIKWFISLFNDDDVRIYSADNKTFVDMNSQSIRLSLNLENPEVLKGIHEQMMKYRDIEI